MITSVGVCVNPFICLQQLTSPEALDQLYLPGWCVEQPVVSLSNLQWPHSGLAFRVHRCISNLSQCLRKAPTITGLGFRITTQRLLVLVQFLMGEISDRHVFFTPGMKMELAPYMAITQAARRGDLSVFNKAASDYAAQLQEDKTYT